MFYFVASDSSDNVVASMETPNGNEVGRTLYTCYLEEDEEAMERVINSTKLQWKYFTQFSEQQEAYQGRIENDGTNYHSFGN